jgi:MFS family permease
VRHAANPKLLVLSGAIRMTLFPIPIVTLFWTQQIGMSLADVMLLQVIFALTAVVMEFPSGYVADRVGYRRALLLGAAFCAVGWVVYASAESFAGIGAAEVLLGTGFAFASGADSALLYRSLSEEERLAGYRRWEGRVRAAGQIAEAGSSAVGGALYAWSPRAPFWLQVPVALAGLGVAVALDEARDAKPDDGASGRVAHWRRALGIVRHALWHHRRLATAMATSVALGISSFLMVWLIQPWMQRRGIPPAWFGPIWAAAHVWLAGVSLASARVADALGVPATLLACCGLVAGSYASLAYFDSPLAVVAYLGFMTLRGLQAPILIGVLQQDAPPDDRASVLSLNALLFRLAFVIAGPPVGVLVDEIGLEPALGILAVVCTTFALAAWIAFIRAHRARFATSYPG